MNSESYVYWTVHHRDSWINVDQHDITCFIVSLFNAQHVSNISTSILRSLRLTVDLFHVLYCSGSMCVGVIVWFGWGGVAPLCRLKLCFMILMAVTMKNAFLWMWYDVWFGSWVPYVAWEWAASSYRVDIYSALTMENLRTSSKQFCEARSVFDNN